MPDNNIAFEGTVSQLARYPNGPPARYERETRDTREIIVAPRDSRAMSRYEGMRVENENMRASHKGLDARVGPRTRNVYGREDRDWDNTDRHRRDT